MTSRIPFALVGVLLLVSSAAFAGSLGGPTVSEPTVDRAMDRTESATQSAVREAVTDAAADAARNPVTVPASNSFGAVLDNTNTFRDSLRVRIYVAVRDRLDRLTRHREDVTVTASLPATPSSGALSDAVERVSIERAGDDGTDLRATVENVTLTARRDGRVVGERTFSPTVTVPVPTLAVHDRVATFERRLNAGPGERGLGGRLTDKLYALTWTRGYAQFGGAAIENVVSNRHLSLLTNSIALSMQEAYFGRSDPRGRSILSWAVAHTAITDGLSGSNGQVADYLSKVQQYTGSDTLPTNILSDSGATDPPVAPEEKTSIAVNSTADAAFFYLLKDLNATIDDTYRARVQLRQRVVDQTTVTVDEPEEPGADWDLLRTSTQKSRSVSTRSASVPDLDGPWHVFEHQPRRVAVRKTITRLWNTSSGVQPTTEVVERRGDVDVLLVGRHDGGPAPSRGIETIHEAGGPLDGPNLERVESAARARLLANRDVDKLAAQALATGDKTTTETVAGDHPDGLYEYVYSDVRWVRERVRDLSITTTRGELATMQTNPAVRLGDKLRERWDDLLALPSEYNSVADRARFNARLAYLQTVLQLLSERAKKHETAREKINEKADEKKMRSIGTVQSDYDNRGSTAGASPLDLQMRVETAPSYLTLGKLDGKSVPTLSPNTSTQPLAARNVNFFTTPYGDVAQSLVRFFLGPKRVRLSTGVQTLKAARRVDGQASQRIAEYADNLEPKVHSSLEHLGSQAALSVAATTPAHIGQAGAVVAAALERWGTTIALGEAWLDGRAIEAIHEEVRARYDLSETRYDRVELFLRGRVRAARESKSAQPPLPVVNGTAKQLKGIIKGELAGQLGDTVSKQLRKKLEQATGKSLSRLPAGLPLAPPVAPWVTTVNYWEVQVRGEYERFSVTVPRGTPETAGARFRYVRDDGTVSLDVDEDGTSERLGRATTVSFRTQTSVAIAVPPKPRGVGDVDGVVDERSSGWPNPG